MIDEVVARAIDERVFPGAVVYVARSGTVLHHAAYGTTMYDDIGSLPVTQETIYDIASLTKLFTATAILQLYDAGELALDDDVRRFLPTVVADGLCIQHLLTHSSGLDIRLSTLRDLSSDALYSAIDATRPQRVPGTSIAYTNVNSTLLGRVIACITGQTLDAALFELILAPLAMQNTGFNPPAERHRRIAPTEWDDAWRGGLVHGRVHDESAAALGGVAGHAGLFSTTADLAHFAELWLAQGSWGGRQLLREATVVLALRDYTAALNSPIAGRSYRSGLGWMLDRSGFMGKTPLGTAGHTGFTGPVIVVQPALGMTVIVLSNRTYPRRTSPPYRHHTITAAIVEEALLV
ncbi:beta-lactamase family protein [Candidatus Gracilibacteria bacterium]|nr:beta-lactamase family protein [Candidatus Gracilibacteria bacterium]